MQSRRPRASYSRDIVKALQRELLQQNFQLGKFGANADGVDGVFGKRTRLAAQAFKDKGGTLPEAIERLLKNTPATRPQPNRRGSSEAPHAAAGERQPPRATPPVRAPQAELPAATKGQRYIIGDSLGKDYMTATGTHGFAVKNATIEQITQQLNQVPKGAHVAVFAGTNNWGTPWSVKSAAEALIKKARERGITIDAWVGPPHVTNEKKWPGREAGLVKVDKTLQNVMRENNIRYINVRQQNLAQYDGLHLTAASHTLLSAQIRSRAVASAPPREAPLQA